MYNKELKERYIKEKTDSVTLPSSYLDCQFNKISDYEAELNKDVHDFTVYEILEYYKMLGVASLEVLAVLNSQLSMYTQWCMQQNLVVDNQNHFEEIELETMKGCLNKALIEKKIVSRGQVLEYCEQLPNPKDQLVILGLFEGMKGKDFCDFVNLKPNDVHDNRLKLDNREITVSRQLLNYIEDSIRVETYYSCSGGGTKTMPLADRGYVIKYYPNTKEDTSAFQKGRVIYNGVARSMSYVGAEYVSANNIFESGKIHMIKQRAKELGMSVKDYVYSEHIKEVENKFNCNIVKSTFWLKYEDHLS